MSYNSANLFRLYDGASGLNEWQYTTTDSFATVLVSGYFNDGYIQGMRPGDAISVIIFTTVNSDGTFSGFSSFNPAAVSVVSAYGGATIIAVGAGTTSLTIGSTSVSGASSGNILTTSGTLLQAGGAVNASSIALGGATIGSLNVACNGAIGVNGSTAAQTYIQFKNAGTSLGIFGSDAAISAGSASDFGFFTYGANNFDIWTNSTRRFRVDGSGNIGFNTGTSAITSQFTVNLSTFNFGNAIFSASSNLFEQVNGVNPNILRVYNTSTSSNANYERLTLGWDGANTAVIGTENAGTGVARSIKFVVGGSTAFTLSTPSTGYGTPTNPAKQASFDATTITLVNLAKCVAQLIIDLKSGNMPTT